MVYGFFYYDSSRFVGKREFGLGFRGRIQVLKLGKSIRSYVEYLEEKVFRFGCRRKNERGLVFRLWWFGCGFAADNHRLLR